MKFVGKDKAQHFLSRAEAFGAGMAHLGDYDLEAFAPAVALLAIHSAISFADAVFVTAKGQRCNEQDHASAIRELARLCAARRFDDAGVAPFRWLIKHKNDVAYLEKRVDINQVKLARLNAERFGIWARKHLRLAAMD
jgi:hypothetical protein